MSQPPTGPEGRPPVTPAPGAPGQPPAGATQPVPQQYGPGPSAADRTVQYGPDQTVAYGQPVGQQYGPGQPVGQQYGPGQPVAGGPSPSDQTVQYGPGQQYGSPQPQYGAGAAQPAPGYPASAPPYPGQPMSAPPVSGPVYGQPMSAPPMSAPPVSGAAYGQPMSAPPGQMPPYGAPTAPAGKGRGVLVLALVAALLFVLGGVMTGLFVTKSNELDRTEKRLTGQVSQRDGTIAANTKEIDKLKVDLQTVQDKLDDTEQDLTGTRNDRDEQARQKKVIATCLDKLTTALGAAAAGNKSAYDSAMKGLDKVCDEADNYL
ncbi:hypothetical protein ACFOW4_28540 [Micromonospora sp. GCM10011542]|uniref:hypothetical protein n=1 Tax=Micromonospora sp. GCM10011542 TaxID=3317337 RepID=UPI00360B3C62